MIDTAKIKGVRAGWFRNCGMPKRFAGVTREDMELAPYNPAMLEAVSTWFTEASTGATDRGLVLQGDPGHGKSMLAAALGNELIGATPREVFQPSQEWIPVRPVYFTSWSVLLRARKRLMDLDDDSELAIQLDRLWAGAHGEAHPSHNQQILVLDDVGSEQITTWNRGCLNDLLRIRLDAGLPTVITTNVPVAHDSAPDWTRHYGVGVASVVHEACEIHNLYNKNGDQRLRSRR